MFQRCIQFVLLCKIVSSLANDPIVQTKVGLVRGIRARDGDYDMFLGVPYGTVNNSNPFGLSSLHPNFEGVFNASSDSKVCPQMEGDTTLGTLDCLHMNIFVPHTASATNRLPVLVYLHGGGLINGNNNKELYNPRFLIKHNIIFVAMNYRVAVYGFMCLRTPEVPGNQGIKDQVLGLRWLRDNIGSFGGDAERITIGGESAGSRSIDLLLLSPYEKLFQNAIMQSGSTFNADWFPEPDLNAAMKLANAMGFSANDNMEALAFLSSSNPRDVMAATANIDSVFRPCVEKEFDNVEILLKDHPLHLDVPKAKNTPILIGSASQEMLPDYFQRSQDFYKRLDLFRTKLNDRFNFEDVMLNEVETIVRNFYISDQNFSQNIWLELADFDSDVAYFHDAIRNVRKFAENGGKKIYYYIFDYKGGRNYHRMHFNLSEHVGGAAHCDERGYLFDVENMTEIPSSRDQLMIDRVTTLWSNFVKYGDPTPRITSLLPVKWEPVRKDSPLYFMNITYDINLATRPYSSRVAFLDLIYKNYGHYEKGFQRNNAFQLYSSTVLCLSYIVFIWLF